MRKLKKAIGVLSLWLWSISAIAQTDSLTLFQTLSSDAILEMRIQTNLRQIIKKKAKKENHAGVLTYQDSNPVFRIWVTQT